MKKINGLMSGIEKSFDELDKRFDRIEVALVGVYVLLGLTVPAILLYGGFL
jgi:hypothetical protein